MKVLINGWFWGIDTAGSGQYLTQLLQAINGLIVQGDSQFIVIIPDGNIPTGQEPIFTPDGPVAFITTPLPKLPRQLAKLWWEQVTMPLAARQQGADLLWIPYWAAPYWQPVPTVVTIHDLIPRLLPEYRGGRLLRLYTSLVSLTAKRATAILTVSQASKQDVIQHLRVEPAKVYPILNGANLYSANLPSASQLSDERLTEARQKYALPDRFFLYLGGFDVRKNVGSILAGYQAYLARGGSPAVKLVIAGKLPSEESNFFPDPQRRVAEMELGEQVYFCGWVDDEDKQSLYQLATAYLFPSLYEGFGMTIIEAMAAGTPVVTSKS